MTQRLDHKALAPEGMRAIVLGATNFAKAWS
jgi:hypothetical protein